MIDVVKRAEGSVVSRIPGMMNVCHKDILAKIMNIWSEVCPEEYDFVPRTFICPEQMA